MNDQILDLFITLKVIALPEVVVVEKVIMITMTMMSIYDNNTGAQRPT